MGVPFSAKELRRILQRDEGKFLEFKSLRERRDWIAEYAAAFSDADGGTHFLGVEDDCSPTGINYPRERGIQRKLGTLSTV